MTTDLRERLDDLLIDVPTHVDADATAAWRAGARRRVRRRLVTGGAVLAMLALVGVVGLTAQRATDPPPADGGATRPAASTYPARVDAPMFSMGDLPDRPGPIAGLIRRNSGWFAVGQRGEVWRMPGATDFDWTASISPDGSRVAYVDRSGGQSELELLDLVDGGAFDPDIGGEGAGHPWLLDGQMSWSPDSSRLFVPVRGGYSYRGPRVDALVVTPGQDAIAVTAPAGADVEPLGWLSPDRLGWLRWTSDEVHPGILVTDVRGGHALRSTPAPGRIPRNRFVNAAALPSTTGLSYAIEVSTVTRQLLISNPGQAGNTALVANRAISNERTGACPPSWADSYPVIPDQAAFSGYLLWAGPGSYAIQVSPALRPVSCSVWAYDALRGGEHRGLGGRAFGDGNSWLSWHWRQVAIGAAALLVAFAGYRLLSRSRRRERRLNLP